MKARTVTCDRVNISTVTALTRSTSCPQVSSMLIYNSHTHLERGFQQSKHPIKLQNQGILVPLPSGNKDGEAILWSYPSRICAVHWPRYPNRATCM
ncbi:hypothetical protein A0H81_04090 [Grifola frondosa]|uniref:Uncharacterized protein n=1 Tax=Grifola frondosa TaxID=5627 RepID=A0A1C7MFZ0_GRIFR|nr:hypothetical protein A0H81_04090 [Grifola frondosa]